MRLRTIARTHSRAEKKAATTLSLRVSSEGLSTVDGSVQNAIGIRVVLYLAEDIEIVVDLSYIKFQV